MGLTTFHWKIPHIQTKCEEHSMKYCVSHKTLLYMDLNNVMSYHMTLNFIFSVASKCHIAHLYTIVFLSVLVLNAY